jgi:hypothetical protein
MEKRPQTSQTMHQLIVDFNNQDASRRVRLSPHLYPVHPGVTGVTGHTDMLQPGQLVQLVDTDGNTCMGILEQAEGRWVVRIQWSYWADAPELPVVPESSHGTAAPH